jgi:pimeloyl-ACP methyl ester carboxylesterase
MLNGLKMGMAAVGLFMCLVSAPARAETPLATPRGVIVLIPGTLNSALPGNVHENPIGQKWEISPYFSIDIVHAFEAQGFAVHTVQDLGPFDGFVDNGEAVARDVSDWYHRYFPKGDVPITFVGHSCGGFYGLYALNKTLDLPIRNLFFVATPLQGSELADTAFQNPWVGDFLQTFVIKTSGLFDLRGLLQASAPNVRNFLAAIPVRRGVSVFSLTGHQSTSWNPFASFDAENMEPLLVPTYSWIGSLAGENDGIVSVRTALGFGAKFRESDGDWFSVTPLPELTMNLDHLEQILDYRLFAPFGIRHREVIRSEQIRVYSGIARKIAELGDVKAASN